LYTGSSTLCLFALDKQKHTLTSLNIGDSGFVIYRNNEIHRRSKSTMNSNSSGPRQLFSVNGAFGLPCFINEKLVKTD
jgi:serine/threonine protein phosphatase PrpC